MTVQEDKEDELRLAKEKAVQEYRDSDALLTELGTSYNDGTAVLAFLSIC